MALRKIVLASSNPGKLKEFSALLSGCQLELITQSDLHITDAEETGLTFVENAILKARHAAAHTQYPTLADDSGIVVDALNGEPGIYSARYSGENASSENNIKKLLTALADVPEKNRTARFVCVLVLMRHQHDPVPIICQATWEGHILFAKQGEQGFGYDPIFWVPTHQCSSAQLPSDLKNTISHRGQAFAQLRHQLSC